MFALVGQVERSFLGREAFQEIDQVATLGGLAKWAAQPRPPTSCRPSSDGPCDEALGGRPGPVLLSLSEDLLDEVVELDAPEHVAWSVGTCHDRGDPRRSSTCSPRPDGPSSWPGWRPPRPDVDRAAEVRRAAPRPGHRRLAPGRRHLERPPPVPGDGRTRGPALGTGPSGGCRRDAGDRLPPQRSDLVRVHHPAGRDALGACGRRARTDRRSSRRRHRHRRGRPRVPPRRERAAARRCRP